MIDHYFILLFFPFFEWVNGTFSEFLFGFGRDKYLTHSDSSLVIVLTGLGFLPFIISSLVFAHIFAQNLRALGLGAFPSTAARMVCAVGICLVLVWIVSFIHYDTALRFGGHHFLVFVTSWLVSVALIRKSVQRVLSF